MITLDKNNFNEEIKKYPRLLVMFYREKGCSHCDKAKPLFIEYAEKADHACAMYQLGDAPDPEVHTKHPVEKFPTFYAFDNGEAVAVHEGVGDFSKMFTPAEPKKKILKVTEAPLSILLSDEIAIMDQVTPLLMNLKEVRAEIEKRKALFSDL